MVSWQPQFLSKIQVSVSEAYYRLNGKYSDSKRVLEDQLLCTICALPIRHRSVTDNNIHPTLEVLCCKKCISFYKTRKVELVGPCRMPICQWCAKNKNLFNCKSCPAKFCDDCLRRNYYLSDHHVFRNIQRCEWKCCFCEPRPIWPQRAVCAAAKNYAYTLHSDLETRRISVRMNLLTSNNQATIVSSSNTSVNSIAVLRGNSVPAEVNNTIRQMPKPEPFVFESLNVVKKSIVEDSSSLCVVCLETPATMVLYKCGHACLCEDCLCQIKASTGLCPICRDKFKDAIKLYK